jgi:hypothetical protein
MVWLVFCWRVHVMIVVVVVVMVVFLVLGD